MLEFNDSKSTESVFKAFLKSKKLYYTFERMLVFQEIQDATKTSVHFAVDSIYQRMLVKKKRVSKGTLYKTLRLLEDCCILKKTDISYGHYIYEKNEQNITGHLVCLKCAKTTEMDKKTIKNLIFDICKKQSFKFKSHTLEIKGLCFDCLKPASCKESDQSPILH